MAKGAKNKHAKVTPTMVFMDKWYDDQIRELYFGPMNKVYLCYIGKRPYRDLKKKEMWSANRDDRFINSYDFTGRYEFVGFL